MRILRTPAQLNSALLGYRVAGTRLGFVPTMGALHEGHRSLLDRAHRECGATVCSVFVNPAQFDDPQDLAKYPATLEADAEICRQAGIDIIFAPAARDIYPEGYRFRVQESGLSTQLCGAHRPGHFDGMLTVVLKLFGLVGPTCAYFGLKDFQQLTLVQDMVRDYFLNVEIVPCPTLREASGLAMSSRNARLSDEDRVRAATIYRSLQASDSTESVREQLRAADFAVDYVEDFRGRRCVAARIGDVRLIDNIALTETAPKTKETLHDSRP